MPPDGCNQRATRSPPGLLPTACASTPTAVPALPHSAIRAATPRNLHTELTAPAAATLFHRRTPRKAPPTLSQTHPSTTRPRRCDASSATPRAPLPPTAAAALATVAHARDQTRVAPPPAPLHSPTSHVPARLRQALPPLPAAPLHSARSLAPAHHPGLRNSCAALHVAARSLPALGLTLLSRVVPSTAPLPVCCKAPCPTPTAPGTTTVVAQTKAAVPGRHALRAPAAAPSVLHLRAAHALLRPQTQPAWARQTTAPLPLPLPTVRVHVTPPASPAASDRPTRRSCPSATLNRLPTLPPTTSPVHLRDVNAAQTPRTSGASLQPLMEPAALYDQLCRWASAAVD